MCGFIGELAGNGVSVPLGNVIKIGGHGQMGLIETPSIHRFILDI